MKKRLLIVLSLAGTCFPAFAQHPEIRFKDLSKERNTPVSVTESHRTGSNDSLSAILSLPDTTRMVSGSNRIRLMTEPCSVKTKISADTIGERGAISRWIMPESKNNN